MRISEIKDKELRELAELRKKEYGGEYGGERLECAFDWHNTLEGFDFWDKVDSGIITELTNKIDKIQVVRDGRLVFKNVNNAPAEDNAIEELRAGGLKTQLDFDLKNIAANGCSPLYEVNVIYEEVLDVKKTAQIINVSDKYNIEPITVVAILKEFRL